MNVETARKHLIALLSDPDRREELRRGELPKAFDTVDQVQLERTAEKIQRDILMRRRRGAPPLIEQFRGSLNGQRIDRIAVAFVRSAHYAAYREVPHGAPGLCIEEAFFRYLDANDIGEPRLRRTEYFRAAAQALVVHEHPAFLVPRPFARVAGAWVVIDHGPTLYAALRGRFVQGRVPQIVADALLGRDVPAAAISRLTALGFSFEDEACRSRPSLSI